MWGCRQRHTNFINHPKVSPDHVDGYHLFGSIGGSLGGHEKFTLVKVAAIKVGGLKVALHPSQAYSVCKHRLAGGHCRLWPSTIVDPDLGGQIDSTAPRSRFTSGLKLRSYPGLFVLWPSSMADSYGRGPQVGRDTVGQAHSKHQSAPDVAYPRPTENHCRIIAIAKILPRAGNWHSNN